MGRVIYLAFTVSIVGLLILTFASQMLEPPLSQIDGINQNSLGKNVHVRGSISDIHEFKGGSIVLVLDDESGEIAVYLPYGVAKSASGSLFESTRLDVTGTVEIYKGKLEIVVESEDCLRIIEE